ncbi:transcriptional regulator, AraC family [Pseudomonas pohangensis]|uniref:Transcriptional regulator, AraC family n=2 Tax=Pseudomonas pohangensis TaxID=364197 RepID=A0A1H2FA99_9PSED|nr:transcriptional regulator, AraC family [Pseudomonas pohangensis]
MVKRLQGQASTAQLLAGSDISEQMLCDASSLINAEQECQVFSNAQRHIADPLWGLELGCKLNQHLSQLGVYGFTLLSAPTLRDALSFSAWGNHLTSTIYFYTLHEDAASARLTLSPKYDHSDCLQLRVDTEMSSVVQTMRVLSVKPIAFDRVQLMHGGVEHRQRYQDFFGCPVDFNQPCNSFTFDKRVLDQALFHGDQDTFDACKLRSQRNIEELECTQHPTSAFVKTLVRRSNDYDLTPNEVASQLNISPRTLRRKLQQEGNSLQGLISHARMSDAIELLINSKRSVEDIALSLSYSDASAFTHAFKRWTGVSPSHYRDNTP